MQAYVWSTARLNKVISVSAEGERNALKQQLLFYPYAFPEMRIDTN